jgi:PAS domain S-box-containing protein
MLRRAVAGLHPAVIRYAIPFATLGAAAAVGLVLARTPAPPVITSFLFLLAFFASAWWGGYVPGIVAALLTLFAAPYLLDLHFNPAQVSAVRAALVLLTSLLISYVAASRRKIETKLRQANEMLDERVRRRTLELQQTNDALRGSEQRLQLAMSAGRMGAWEWDIAAGRINWSPQLEAIHGLASGSFGGTFAEFAGQVHPDHRARVIETIERAVKTRTDYRVEYLSTLPGGGLTWLEARGQLSFDEKGEPVRMNGICMDVTARKQAELALQASETHLRLVMDGMPALVSYVDRDWRYRFVNQRYSEWFGLPREHFEGKTVAEAVGAERFEMIRAHMERALGGEPVVFEIAHSYQGDASRDVRATYLPHRGSKGEVLGCVVLVEDITAQKRAEAVIRASEQRYRALVEASAQFVWIAGASEKNDDSARWWADLTGQTNVAEEALGWLDVIHPDDRDRVKTEWAAAEQARTVFNGECRVRTRDGGYGEFAVRGVPVWNADGSFREWVGTLTDITAAKRAARALRESEERYRLIVETAAEGIWTIDADGITTFANTRIAQWLGYTVEQMIGRPTLDFVFADDRGAARTAFEKRANTPVTAGELRLERRDGSVVWFHLSASVLRDPEGRLGMLAMLTEIDQRKRAEDARVVLERQLTLLIEASGTLLASPEQTEVLRTILDLAKRFVNADAYAVWRKAEDGAGWRMIAVEGLSESYQRNIPAADSVIMPAHPVAMEDVLEGDLVRHRAQTGVYEREGIRSLLTIPLHLQGETGGTLAFYYRSPHKFADAELRIATALGNLAAAALGAAELYDRESALRRAAEDEERRSSFLAKAGEILASSLDPQATLTSVVDLAVPIFADWAVIDMVQPSGELQRVSVKHADPAKAALALEYSRRYPPAAVDTEGGALRSMRAVLLSDISEPLLLARAKDADHLRFIRELGLRSAIAAPMVANGQPIGVLGFAFAESGRCYTERDLAFAEELARRAATAVANARLFTETRSAQVALRRANAELRRANEDLNQFAYSASHDLQEPLRMVIIYSQLLERKYRRQLDEQADLYIQYLIDGAKRMELLLKDLLTYTQTVNAVPERSAPVDLNMVVAKALSNLSAAIGETGAEVSYGDLPLLAAEEIHLVQLFQNIIGNAIKYRGDDRPRIEIDAQRNGVEWQIAIRDNGIGIAPEYRQQVFKIFKRLHPQDKYSGTGIGLAICQRIVERYGGRIWVESDEGLGSTFCFTFPLAE